MTSGDDGFEVFLSITQLLAVYADVASRRAWEEMAAIVTRDASFSFDVGGGSPIELVGPDELREFGAAATAGFRFYSYRTLNAVLTSQDTPTATGRVHSLEVGVDAEHGDWLEFYGEYDDEYVFDRGRWLFRRRRFDLLQRRVVGGAGSAP